MQPGGAIQFKREIIFQVFSCNSEITELIEREIPGRLEGRRMASQTHQRRTSSQAGALRSSGVKILTVITRFLRTAILTGIVTLANGERIPRPDVPEKIRPPAGEEVVLEAHASGSQIYICQQGTNSKYGWTLKAPEAELRDQQGAIIGRHYSGPTWKHTDGSEVIGRITARVDSPDSDSIPWVLVTATAHSGDGVLSHVTIIQRINTRGGQPPPSTDCDAPRQNSEILRSYTADYYFYAPPR
jgi:hypothetical protein